MDRVLYVNCLQRLCIERVELMCLCTAALELSKDSSQHVMTVRVGLRPLGQTHQCLKRTDWCEIERNHI